MMKKRHNSKNESHSYQKLHKPRNSNTENQDFAWEGDTAAQSGVLAHDSCAAAQDLLNKVPDEVATQKKGPIMIYLNSNHVAEDRDQQERGQQRVQQGPEKPQK